MVDTTWTPIDDPTAFQDDAVFEIDKTTKTIQVLVEQPIVAGENKSQFVKFQMGRYYDAIDLTQMEVNILYESPTGYQDISTAVNREYSDEYIRFGWLVPYAACPVKGTLGFAVEFVGADYVLKTTRGETPVLDSISGSSSVPEPTEQTWYIELQSQVASTLQTASDALEKSQQIINALATPQNASLASEMSDTSAVYVYTGSESGYTFGNWYYHNGTEWVSGGLYVSTDYLIDPTLSQSGQAADAKVVGDEISDLKEDLDTCEWMLSKSYPFTINNNKYITNGSLINGTVVTNLRASTDIIDVFADTIVLVPQHGYKIAVGAKHGTTWEYVGTNITNTTQINLSEYDQFFITAQSTTNITHTDDALIYSKVAEDIANALSSKQDKICINLVGMRLNYLYPVSDVTTGTYLTFSTSDGEPIGLNPGQTNISFYDRNKNFITYYGFPSNSSSRTVGPFAQDFADTSYIAITGSLPRVPIMVNIGKTAEAYESYFFSSTAVTEEVYGLQDRVSYIESEFSDDLAATNALSHHVSNSTSPAKNTLTLLWCTDIHAEKERTRRMVNILNSWGLFDIAINTGDTTSILETEGLSWYDDIINTSNVAVLNTVGNHDAWTALSGTLAPQTDVYNMIIAPVASQTSIVQPSNAASQGLCYYYKDVNGIRIIVLDCMYWDANELSWFESTLADAKTNGHPIIACVHYPFESNYRTLVDSIWNIGVTNVSTSIVPISAAEAVNSFINSGGTFICWLQGHSHTDRIVKLEDYGNQLCLQATSFTNRETTVYKGIQPYYYDYDALTVVTIDTIDKTLKIYRIGANINGVGQKYNSFAWNYETTAMLADW